MKKVLARRSVLLRRTPFLINFRIQPLMPRESGTEQSMRSGLMKLFKVRIGLVARESRAERVGCADTKESGDKRDGDGAGERGAERSGGGRGRRKKVECKQERKGRRCRAVI